MKWLISPSLSGDGDKKGSKKSSGGSGGVDLFDMLTEVDILKNFNVSEWEKSIIEGVKWQAKQAAFDSLSQVGKMFLRSFLSMRTRRRCHYAGTCAVLRRYFKWF